MKRIFCALLLFAAVTSMTTGTLANDFCMKTYTGKFWYGEPMATNLCLAGGNLQGYYVFEYQGKLYQGQLTDLKLTGQTLTGNWKDDYGSEPIEFVFNADFTEFRGHYLWGGSPIPWDGKLAN